MRFETVKIGDLDIFYREGGDPSLPKLLLLHGFPASSHQYRNLITLLERHFHVVAPDYPGFGNSALPSPDSFKYTFDNIAEVIEQFLQHIGFNSFGLYVQDYGGPVGFRIVAKHPEWLQWLIIQNTNAYEVGFTAVWDELRSNYWKDRSEKNEKAIGAFLEPTTVKAVYLTGHPHPELISPDNWNMDNHLLERPNAKQVQLDLFYDYRTNVALYPSWQQFLRDRQPKTIIFWGQGDIFFTPQGGEAYLKDLPNAELHRLDSGHFALEDNLKAIASGIERFYDNVVRAGWVS
jgi:pimeloyl-ACP methyl ester carboxylesterase